MNKQLSTILIMVGAGATLYLLLRSDIRAGAAGVADIASGTVGSDSADNPYYGKGILGTAGFVFNKASGGIFQKLGSKLGGFAADMAGN